MEVVVFMSKTMHSQRDIGLDISRIVAFISVACVHFFLNTGFYQQPVVGIQMYLMVLLRTMFMVCVPMFILLTGYLMSNRNIDTTPKALGAFYRHQFPIWLSYVLATTLIILYRTVFLHEPFTIAGTMQNILGFSQYSWYVNMYLGFSLLIPFINLIWKGISSKNGAKALLLILFVLTALPSVLNTFDFQTPGALGHPWLAVSNMKIVPDWWTSIYPITYYFIGAYLKKYVNIKSLRTGWLMLLFILSVILFTANNIWRSYSKPFVWGIWQDWGSLQNMINAVLLFLILNSFCYPKGFQLGKRFLSYISSLTFSAYLCSWITDNFLYSRFCEDVPVMARLQYFPIMVGLTLVGSLVLAAVIQFAVKVLTSIKIPYRW